MPWRALDRFYRRFTPKMREFADIPKKRYASQSQPTIHASLFIQTKSSPASAEYIEIHKNVDRTIENMKNAGCETILHERRRSSVALVGRLGNLRTVSHSPNKKPR